MFLKKLVPLITDTRLSRGKFITIQFSRGLREMETKSNLSSLDTDFHQFSPKAHH